MAKEKKPLNPLRRLTFEERILIEDRLNFKKSLTEIAVELKRTVSTIGREIKNHSKTLKSLKNDCTLKHGCIHKNICGDQTCKNFCSRCPKKIMCKRYCSDYERRICPKLDKPPYVCNGCPIE